MKVSRIISGSVANRIALFGVFGVLLLIVFAAIGTNAQTKSFGLSVGFSKVFQPDTIGPGSTTTLRFNINNSENSNPVSDLAFTDTLPTGIVIATPASASTTCGAGSVLSAPDGGTTISLSGGTLGAFSSCQVTVNVIGTATATNVSGDLTSSAGNSGSATATLTVDTARPGFSKAFAPGSIPLGGTSTLTFTIDNTANMSNITQFNFSDTLPAGMVIATPASFSTTCGTPPVQPSITATSGTNSISISYFGSASLPAVTSGATCTVSVNVTANTTGVLVNTSNELLTGVSSVSSGFSTAALNVPVNFLVKSFINDPVPPGANVTLRFTLQNPSRDFAATGVAFTDDLNAVLTGLTFNSLLANDCGGTVAGVGTTDINFSGGTLAAGGSCTISVSLTVPAGAAPGTYTNTTGAIMATIDGSPVVGNMATDQLVVSLAPTFTKEFIDDPAAAGGTATLRFTITNNNPGAGLSDIEFTDDLSTAIPNLTATLPPAPDPPCGPSSSLSGSGTLSFTGGSLASAGTTGDSCTFDVVVNIPAGVPSGVYTNTTSDISGSFFSPVKELGKMPGVTGLPASGDLIVVGAPRLVKEFIDDPAQPGGTVTLQFTLSHDATATGDATGIAFTDDLNATLSGLTANGTPLTDLCGPGNGTLTSSSGDTFLTASDITLTPGQVCTFSATLQVPAAAAGGSYTNTTSPVTATVDGVSGVIGNPATDDLRIAGILLTKEFINDPVVPGDTTTLRFTIANINPTDDATGIFFTDNLGGSTGTLPGLAAMAPLPDTSACGGGSSLSGTTNLFFFGGDLNAGTSCSFDVTLQVPAAADDGTYPNVTSSVSATLGGSGFTGDPATDTLTVNSELLALTKEFTDDPVTPGGNVTLQFTLTNLDSTQAASNLAFSDNLNAVLPGLVATTSLPFAACGGTVSTPNGGQSIDLTGGSLAASGSAGDSCTFSLTLSVPANAPPNSQFTNTTSQVTGTIGGFAVNGAPATDNLMIGFADNIAPVISYTPLPATQSPANPTLSVTITDAVGVDSSRVRIFFRINAGAFTSNLCTLATGTIQNGTWDCPITGTLTNPSAITYYVSAQDFAPNTGSNPVPGVAAPNLYTIGPGVVPAGTYTNLSLSNGTTFSGNVTVLGVLTLDGIVGTDIILPPEFVDKNLNGGTPPTLTLGCGATISGGGPTNYILGNLAKQYCAPGLFLYPVGTSRDNALSNGTIGPSEYSPFTADVTALGTNPSTLRVSVTDGILQGIGPEQSASRYWTVTETGDLTANISFTYLDQDVNGVESSYKVLRRDILFPEIYPGGMVDTVTNTATAPGVTNFSRWAAGNLGPTAALVNIGGRVLTPSGQGISGAGVSLTGPDGNVVILRTNSFGYYRFNDIPVGETYVLAAQDKRYSFDKNSRVLFINGEDLGINFVATGID